MRPLFAPSQPSAPAIVKAGDSSTTIINRISVFVLLLGILIVLVFGANASSKATIFIWMLACLMTGTAIGFLFGIPKILQNNTAAQAAGAAGNAPPPPAYQQQVNTNLTEISDWLTKIIVGLGLVNLTKLPPYMHRIASILGQGVSHPAKQPSSLAIAFAYGTIISYFILGFLFGYIMTRLYLAVVFSDADRKSTNISQQQLDEVKATANSAYNKAEFALVKPTELPANGNEPPEHKLVQLATHYVNTRSQMPSGSARTTKMGQIFKSMIEVSTKIDNLNVSEQLGETDSGKRLSGYAYLYAKPDWTYVSELIDAISTDPTPFGQYWGIQTLGKVLDSQPGRKLEDADLQKLKAYYQTLKKGIDREYELRKLLPELAQ